MDCCFKEKQNMNPIYSLVPLSQILKNHDGQPYPILSKLLSANADAPARAVRLSRLKASWDDICTLGITGTSFSQSVLGNGIGCNMFQAYRLRSLPPPKLLTSTLSSLSTLATYNARFNLSILTILQTGLGLQSCKGFTTLLRN